MAPRQAISCSPAASAGLDGCVPRPASQPHRPSSQPIPCPQPSIATHVQMRSTPCSPYRRCHSCGGQRRWRYEASSQRAHTTARRPRGRPLSECSGSTATNLQAAGAGRRPVCVPASPRAACMQLQGRAPRHRPVGEGVHSPPPTPTPPPPTYPPELVLALNEGGHAGGSGLHLEQRHHNLRVRVLLHTQTAYLRRKQQSTGRWGTQACRPRDQARRRSGRGAICRALH